MTPSHYGNNHANMLRLTYDGNLDYAAVDWDGCNVRPVINLKADTAFVAGGHGTIVNPYIVAD